MSQSSISGDEVGDDFTLLLILKYIDAAKRYAAKVERTTSWCIPEPSSMSRELHRALAAKLREMRILITGVDVGPGGRRVWEMRIMTEAEVQQQQANEALPAAAAAGLSAPVPEAAQQDYAAAAAGPSVARCRCPRGNCNHAPSIAVLPPWAVPSNPLMRYK